MTWVTKQFSVATGAQKMPLTDAVVIITIIASILLNMLNKFVKLASDSFCLYEQIQLL